MDIHLSPDLEQLVRHRIDTGQYGSPSDVIRDALNLLSERDRFRDEIRAKIAAGLADQRAGRVSDGDKFFDRLEAELKALEG